MNRPSIARAEASPTELQIQNLYGRLAALRRLRGLITPSSSKDFNGMVRTLGSMQVLTPTDVFAFHVKETVGIEEALFSGLPERAGQMMALLEERFPKLRARENQALLEWYVRDGVPLSLVVSDISDSCRLSSVYGNAEWPEVVERLVSVSRELSGKKGGFFVKTSGDDTLVVFRDAASALEFAVELHHATKHPQIALHQGLHFGQVAIRAADVIGPEVNLAYRVSSWAESGQIAATDRFRKEIRNTGSTSLNGLPWKKSPGILLKGFERKLTLWRLEPEPPK